MLTAASARVPYFAMQPSHRRNFTIIATAHAEPANTGMATAIEMKTWIAARSERLDLLPCELRQCVAMTIPGFALA